MLSDVGGAASSSFLYTDISGSGIFGPVFFGRRIVMGFGMPERAGPLAGFNGFGAPFSFTLTPMEPSRSINFASTKTILLASA